MKNYNIQNENGMYYVYFYVTDTNGKRKQMHKSTGIKAKSGNKGKAEAEAQKIVEKYGYISYDYSNMLLSEYIDKWIERNRNTLQTTTYDNYIMMNRKHIKPYFDNMKLKLIDLKPYHIDEYANAKLSQKLSTKYINNQKALIKVVVNDAMANGIVTTNAVMLSKNVKNTKKHKPIEDFTMNEMVQYANDILQTYRGTPIEVPVYLALYYGLRKNEIIGLKWSNIDFDKRVIHIRNKITRKITGSKTTIEESETLKTEASRDDYPMLQEQYEYLLNLKKEQEKYIRITNEYYDYVCVNQIGELLSPDYVSAKFAKIMKASELKIKTTFHGLRTLCITLLGNSGQLTDKQMQKYARHSNYSTTMNVYAFASRDTMSIGLQTMTELLSAKV